MAYNKYEVQVPNLVQGETTANFWAAQGKEILKGVADREASRLASAKLQEQRAYDAKKSVFDTNLDTQSKIAVEKAKAGMKKPKPFTTSDLKNLWISLGEAPTDPQLLNEYNDRKAQLLKLHDMLASSKTVSSEMANQIFSGTQGSSADRAAAADAVLEANRKKKANEPGVGSFMVDTTTDAANSIASGYKGSMLDQTLGEAGGQGGSAFAPAGVPEQAEDFAAQVSNTKGKGVPKNTIETTINNLEDQLYALQTAPGKVDGAKVKELRNSIKKLKQYEFRAKD